MIFIWLSYDFVLVYVYVQSMLHWWVYSIYSISVDLLDCYQLFFSPSLSSCYYGTLKRVYETRNLANNAFFKHFVFEKNLIFNIIKLTFLASESFKIIQKTLHLKDISFHQLLIPTKRYLWKFFFSILFTGSIWTPSFSWKVLTSAIF